MGKVVDLAAGAPLPERFGLDSNVLATRFIPQTRVTASDAARRARVRAFFGACRTQGVTGFVPSIVLLEFIHVAIKAKYTADLTTYASTIGGKKYWELLYKARPDLLHGYRPGLRRLLRLMRLANLVVIQPSDLAPLPDDRRLEAELIDSVDRYLLDTRDAAILLEMRRAGLDAIVTEDPDLRRAATDFDIYTWL